MWGASVLPALFAGAAVSALFLAFFVLEHCVNAQCPYKDAVPASTVPLPRVNAEVVLQLARVAVTQQRPWDLTTGSLFCIAKSQMACVAVITFAWCSTSCALLLLLSVLCPNPRREEKIAFRNASIFSFLQQALMLTYLVGVDGGFQDATLCLLLWCCKCCSRQLQSVLPMRSEAIRKARQVHTGSLLKLLSAYSSGAVMSTAASVWLWSLRPLMSPLVFLELWCIPLDALTFLRLAFSESLHIAEELTYSGKHSEPLMTAEKRIELSESAALLQGVVKGGVILCHRLTMLWCFGVHWRVADFLLLCEIRLSIIRVLQNVQQRLQLSIAHIQAHESYPCATKEYTYSNLNADEVGEENLCPICQALLVSEISTESTQKLTQQQSKLPKRLPCGHVFHLSCLVRWITHNQGKSVACPMCRALLHSDVHRANCWQASAVQALEWWMECPWQLVWWLVARTSQRLQSQMHRQSAAAPSSSGRQPAALGAAGQSEALASHMVNTQIPPATPPHAVHGCASTPDTQIVEESVTYLQSDVRAGSGASFRHRRVGRSESSAHVLDSQDVQSHPDLSNISRMGGQTGGATLEDPRTPAWGVAPPATHQLGVHTNAPQNVHASDAMVGTEVAAMVLQSPLWGMMSPSLTGLSGRRWL